ncbi:hypothetical protein BDA99DRAFT_607936 [Phascolomyces articulosus]|uniref:Uncharacterized protein n=1 Tax=Phascolomyces articulosus TaxID=60185 RepID=A0AAD5PA99_9FUNG|nr:hypothetical protein BDA99DRAFT_607936 [Phascolomyces articulosus]
MDHILATVKTFSIKAYFKAIGASTQRSGEASFKYHVDTIAAWKKRKSTRVFVMWARKEQKDGYPYLKTGEAIEFWEDLETNRNERLAALAKRSAISRLERDLYRSIAAASSSSTSVPEPATIVQNRKRKSEYVFANDDKNSKKSNGKHKRRK